MACCFAVRDRLLHRVLCDLVWEMLFLTKFLWTAEAVVLASNMR
jgi:hypothetical protein